ncbi:AAA family ATPase [Mameliella alba]|nr:AAA family ATPase [Antarctobacter heliothermus]MBY6145247.1 AAA family ATPase [Mameliella alba]MCA0954995.1 AAA family ATPase [Mameliella alba]
MISDLEISTFRKIERIGLQELGRFNLIVGKNNSGKTSILEAAALGLSGGLERDILSIARTRDSRSNVVFSGATYLADIVSWMFPASAQGFWDVDFSGKIGIQLKVKDDIYSLHMVSNRAYHERDQTLLQYEEFSRSPSHLRGVEVISRAYRKTPEDSQPKEFRTTHFQLGDKKSDRSALSSVNLGKTILPYEYITPYSHRNSNNSERYVDRLIDDAEREDLVKLLQSIDGDVLDISSAPYSRESHSRGGRAVVTTKAGKLIPLSVMGDGFRRICELGFALHFSRGGVLFIDEIEAGFHIGMLKKVYLWLTRQAKNLGVQIIATSHSLEAIQALVDVTPQDTRNDNLRAYSIGLDRSFGRIRHFYGDELYSLVSESGLDIR